MALSNRAVVFLAEETQLERKGVIALWCALIQILSLCTTWPWEPVTNFSWDFWNYICIIPTITFLPPSTRMPVIPGLASTGQRQGKWDRRSSVLISPGFYWEVTMQRHFCKKGNSLSAQVLWSEYRKGRAVGSMQIYQYFLHFGLPMFNQLINYMWCKML